VLCSFRGHVFRFHHCHFRNTISYTWALQRWCCHLFCLVTVGVRVLLPSSVHSHYQTHPFVILQPFTLNFSLNPNAHSPKSTSNPNSQTATPFVAVAAPIPFPFLMLKPVGKPLTPQRQFLKHLCY